MSESSDSNAPKDYFPHEDTGDASNTCDAESMPQQALVNESQVDFGSYTADGNFCVYFKLMRSRQDAEQDIRRDTFYPDFVHQFFVDTERIFGYKKPVIRLFYSASRLKRYINFDYEEKLNREQHGIEPDDVLDCLNPVLNGLEWTQDLNQFIADLESKEEKEFRPPGDLLCETTIEYSLPSLLSRAQREQLELAGESVLPSGSTNGASLNGFSASSSANNHSHQNGNPSTASASTDRPHLTEADNNNALTTTKKKFQIFHANRDTRNFGPFQARMQTLIMWFIESATMIDFEDPRWDFFLIFEKYNPSDDCENSQETSLSTEDRYYFVGYSSVYRYYAYPDRTRPRVSQMLLLPPYRKNGIGTYLLQAIYDYYKIQPATLDITAEDPDEEFISMRDFLDCKNCLQLTHFQPERLSQGWSEEMAKEAQEKLRLCQRQSRKVYEILKLYRLNPDNEEDHRKYRLEIKNRLNIPNQRLKLDCDKVRKLGIELPDDMRNRLDNPRLAVTMLDENYQELERQYRRTIQKLNRIR